MDVEDKEIIYISSSDRIAGDSSNFLFKMDIDTNALYDHITVLQASIPKSYYLISSDNDEFILNENLINIVIKIPNGNYTINAFKKTIADLLNINSPIIGFIVYHFQMVTHQTRGNLFLRYRVIMRSLNLYLMSIYSSSSALIRGLMNLIMIH